MGKILRIPCKLNFFPNTLGCLNAQKFTRSFVASFSLKIDHAQAADPHTNCITSNVVHRDESEKWECYHVAFDTRMQDAQIFDERDEI